MFDRLRMVTMLSSDDAFCFAKANRPCRGKLQTTVLRVATNPTLHGKSSTVLLTDAPRQNLPGNRGGTARAQEAHRGGLPKQKFLHKLSDHLPLWMQINTDIDGRKLEQIIQG